MAPTVWITGAYGFIGRQLANHLSQQGLKVIGIGNGQWSDVDAKSWGVSHWLEGEINSHNLDALLSIHGTPDTIFHLAGGASVGESIADPYLDFQRTVATVAELVEWIRQHAANTRLVAVSSAAVYGVGHDNQIAVDAKLNPFSPYGFHKMMMESLCKSYGDSYGLRSVVVRLFSVYGSGLRKQLLWDICSRVYAKTPVLTLGGTGNELRDWTDVRDIVCLLAKSANLATEHSPVINGGSGIGTPINDIAEIIVDAWGTNTPIEFSGQSRAGDPKNLVSVPCKLENSHFDWHYSVKDGISDYVKWFKKEME